MANGQAEAGVHIAAYKRTVDTALQALRANRREDAGLMLWDALQKLDVLDDDQLCRSLAGRLGTVCQQVGFDDLALFSLDVAIELGDKLNDVRALENDRLTLGNVQLRLGNLREAEAAYQLVEDAAIRHGDYANAASASTNLASILVSEGYILEAAERLERSLEYLGREPFPSTELNTRFLLVQILESAGERPARVLDVAEPLSAWADQLAEPHRARLVEVIEGALTAEPYRRDRFAWLLEQL